MDLLKSEGINKSLSNNIDTILHLVNKKKIKHFIYISIVGIDKISLGYYQAKVECERLIKSSGIPYTILKATQFHDFVDDGVSKLLKLHISVVQKKLKVQPIQIESVAKELDKIAKESPANTTYNLGGKKIYTFKEIVESLLKVRHENKMILNMPIIGGVMKAFARGKNT
ncbi:hypothetical protein I4U23_005199 [Adineta vaga]|nr:hypothetical protein I4U23_005199 [Adineta vaga]